MLCSYKMTYIVCGKMTLFCGKFSIITLKIKVFQNVSFVETLCFYGRNTLFPWEKQSVSTIGTMLKQYQESRQMSKSLARLKLTVPL